MPEEMFLKLPNTVCSVGQKADKPESCGGKAPVHGSRGTLAMRVNDQKMLRGEQSTIIKPAG